VGILAPSSRPTTPRYIYTTAFLNRRPRPITPTEAWKRDLANCSITNTRAAERAAGGTLHGDMVDRHNKMREGRKKRREKKREERKTKWKRRVRGDVVAWLKAKLSHKK
jgi:hypothetical protein